MRYLLDTSILEAFAKPNPNGKKLKDWLSKQEDRHLFVSV
jgi:hypothetical protein